MVPSRLYGVLAAGRPVIAAAETGARAQTVNRIGCGVVVPPGRPELLAAAIRSAYYDGTLDLEEMGKRGRRYVEAEADRRVAVARYRSLLGELVRDQEMNRRRVVLATVGLVVLAAAAVGVGRWERGHQARVQSDGMARVLAAIDGRLVQPALSGTYSAGPLVCFLYDTRERVYGVSVCFDGSGRLAEAVDARSGTPSWWSLRFEPSLGRYRVNPAEVRGASAFLAARKVYSGVKATVNPPLPRLYGAGRHAGERAPRAEESRGQCMAVAGPGASRLSTVGEGFGRAPDRAASALSGACVGRPAVRDRLCRRGGGGGRDRSRNAAGVDHVAVRPPGRSQPGRESHGCNCRRPRTGDGAAQGSVRARAHRLMRRILGLGAADRVQPE